METSPDHWSPFSLSYWRDSSSLTFSPSLCIPIPVSLTLRRHSLAPPYFFSCFYHPLVGQSIQIVLVLISHVSLIALVPTLLWLMDPSSIILLQGSGLWSLSSFLPLFLIIRRPLLALKNRTFQSQAKCNWDLAPENLLYPFDLW